MIYIIAVIFAIIRIAGHKSEAFQAVAHLFVGWLFGAAYFQYRPRKSSAMPARLPPSMLPIALSLIELACFLWFRLATGFH